MYKHSKGTDTATSSLIDQATTDQDLELRKHMSYFHAPTAISQTTSASTQSGGIVRIRWPLVIARWLLYFKQTRGVFELAIFRTDLLEFYLRAGFAVVMFNYRGSPGRPAR